MRTFKKVFLGLLLICCSPSVGRGGINSQSPSVHFGTNLGYIQHSYSPQLRLGAGFMSFVLFPLWEKFYFRILSNNLLNFSSVHNLEVYNSHIYGRSFYTSTFFSLQGVWEIPPFLFRNRPIFLSAGPCAGLISLRFSKSSISQGYFQPYYKFTSTNWGWHIGLGMNFAENYLLELNYQVSRGKKFDVLGGPYNSISFIHGEKSPHYFIQHLLFLQLSLQVF